MSDREIINVRTIKDEYLIAMKLMSGRIYKNDISDIIGIIISNKKNGKDVTYDMIDKAIKNLYGSWDGVDKDIIKILDDILSTNNLEELYNKTISEEQNSRQSLIEFDEKYNNAINEANVKEILKLLKKNGK